MNDKRLRVCVCTSLAAAQEPRAPRHAAAIAALGTGVEVVFVDSAPAGAGRQPVKALEGFPNLAWQTHYFTTRTGNPVRLAGERIWQRLAQVLYRFGGPMVPAALSTRAIGLECMLRATAADIYLAHNIETLLPAFRAAQSQGALVMFDSMEFHSDMGDSQTAVERAIVRSVEKKCLPGCALLLASSTQVADALAAEYGLSCPLPLDNAPLIEKELPPKSDKGLQLYWRNAVVGLGQRGLDEALLALTKLPVDVTLHLQGRMPVDGGAALRARIAELKLEDRVIFHPPYLPEDAVRVAARHHVGLCLERKANRNHELTTSNKIFDYHMAGLAVIASDLPGLHGVIERSGGGLLFAPGVVNDLTAKIQMLYRDTPLRAQLAGKARAFALSEGNRENEMKKFAAAFADVCRARLGVAFN